MSETATVEETQLVSAPDRSTLYMARRSELRLVIRKERQRFDAEGNPIETIEGEHVVFMDGQLRIPDAPTMRGEKGEELETAKVRAFLDGHHLNGNREEGFWLLEQPAPPMGEAEQDKLTELAQDLDVDGLERFIAAESAGWKREQVLAVAGGALERARTRREAHEKELADARTAGESTAKLQARETPKSKPAG